MAILLAGATGLIGAIVARQLPPSALTIIARKPLDLAQSVTQLTGNAQDWPKLISTTRPTVAVSTLGTTMRQAGSEDAFRAVDLDLVLSFAAAAKEAGAQRFITISSVGASSSSRNFYLRTKGEAEDGLKALGFDRLDILRPGLLRGERGGQRRIGERIAILASPISDFLTPAAFDQYRSIAAETVAEAVVTLSGKTEAGIYVHHNREMAALARR